MVVNNLVELCGWQGVMVCSIKVQVLIEMFQVMVELEGFCVWFVVRCVFQVWGVEINEIYQRFVVVGDVGDVDVFYDINQEFYEVIYEVLCNIFFGEQM